MRPALPGPSARPRRDGWKSGHRGQPKRGRPGAPACAGAPGRLFQARLLFGGLLLRARVTAW
jgi:hypothetical protein